MTTTEERIPTGTDNGLTTGTPSAQLDELVQILAQTKARIEARSYSGRHPDLGRMFKCAVCNRRHRGNPCEQQFATVTYEDVETGELESYLLQVTPTRGVGQSAFKGRRLVPRINRSGRLLVQKTRELYPEFAQRRKASGIFKYSTERETMYAARKEAAKQIHASLHNSRKRARKQQQLSRRINAGLVRAGEVL